MYSIFCVYTMYMPCIYMVYTWYIHSILYTPPCGWCCGGGQGRRGAGARALGKDPRRARAAVGKDTRGARGAQWGRMRAARAARAARGGEGCARRARRAVGNQGKDAPTHLRSSAYILSRRHGHARAHARTSARPRTPERASTLQ